jgi:hypothetical protein
MVRLVSCGVRECSSRQADRQGNRETKWKERLRTEYVLGPETLPTALPLHRDYR